MKILYIEDEPIILMSVTDDLEDAGHYVITASSCDRGLDLLAKFADIDLVVTDISTPGKINGWELAEKVRELYSNLPVIYTTAFSNEPRVVSNSRFITKPFACAELLQAIKELA